MMVQNKMTYMAGLNNKIVPTTPLFSIIIPSYNRSHVITNAVNSILKQTVINFEIIVVDDGSYDSTQSVIKQIGDERVHYFYQENQGVSAARNAGIKMARGKYVTFLDSDDEVQSDWLENYQYVFNSVSNAGIVCCGIQVINKPSEIKQTIFPKYLGPLFGSTKLLFRAGTFAVPRQLLIDVGSYVNNLTYAENTELALRMVEYCYSNSLSMVSIDKALVIYNREATGGARKQQFIEGHLASYEYILTHYEQKFTLDLKLYSNYLATAGVLAARVSDYDKARKFFKRAVLAYPRDLKHFLRLALSFSPFLSSRLWR